MNHTQNIITGLCSTLSQIMGHLFLENVKMEKQRTNLPYKIIINHFVSSPRAYFNGFFPYGIIQSFGKGYIVSSTRGFVEPNLHFSSTVNNISLGLCTGLAEAVFLSPLLSIRNHLNQNLIENTQKRLRIHPQLIFKGINALIAKRTLDWSSRYVAIDIFSRYSPISNIIINTFMASGLSTIISTPLDRLLPLIYSNQSIMSVFKQQGLPFLYKGFVFRFLSTGYYTTCILVLPPYLKNIIELN